MPPAYYLAAFSHAPVGSLACEPLLLSGAFPRCGISSYDLQLKSCLVEWPTLHLLSTPTVEPDRLRRPGRFPRGGRKEERRIEARYRWQGTSERNCTTTPRLRPLPTLPFFPRCSLPHSSRTMRTSHTSEKTKAPEWNWHSALRVRPCGQTVCGARANSTSRFNSASRSD